jgi:diamine N-acetyltransferase
VISGERVRLRAIERSDLPHFAAWLNDPEVAAGLMVFRPLSLVNEEQWFAEAMKRPLEEQPLMIEIAHGDAWIPAGNCGFHQINWRSRSAEVGIFIGEKSYWNQGYGSDAMRLLLKYGFDVLNLHRIGLEVFENNLRAVRSYEKVGFVVEGRKRQAHFQDGHYWDIIIMSILQPEWQNARTS